MYSIIEKRSNEVTKIKCVNYGIGWHIQIKNVHLPKNQAVSANWWRDINRGYYMAARRYKIFLRMSKENFGGDTSSLTKTSTVKNVLSTLNGKQRQEREKIREISDRLSLYILTVSLF